MMGDELRQLLVEQDAPLREPPADSFAGALDVLASEMMALTEAILRHDYADAVRLQRRVARSLAHAEALGEVPSLEMDREPTPCGLDHEPALARLARIRQISTVVLEVAPSPSAAALAHARRGDMAVWEQEVRVWIAAGQHPDTPPTRRRSRPETEPDTPTALREAHPAIAAMALAPARDKSRPPMTAPHRTGTP